MSLDENNSQYSKIAKLFHWGFVFLFIYGFKIIYLKYSKI